MNKIIYSLVYNRKKCLNKRGMALVQVGKLIWTERRNTFQPKSI